MAECPGLYVHACAADGLLARVRLPGGRLNARGAHGIAEAARSLGSGTIELTARANLQIRGLTEKTAPHLAPLLASYGLGPIDPAADRRRNILADPLAGLDPTEIEDMSPLVAALDAALIAHRSLKGLSPKFSFALDGGGRSASISFPHDVGLKAERDADGAIIYRLWLAGRSTDVIARSRHGAIEKLIEAAEVAASSEGLLSPPHPEALEGCGEKAKPVLSPVEGMRGAGPDASRLPQNETHSAFFIGRHETSDFKIALGLSPFVGTLDSFSLDILADLALTFGAGALRLTPRRSILIPGVAAVATVEREAEKHGFLIKPPPISVIACSGLSCARGRADVKRDAASLARAFAAFSPRNGVPLIHISGCPRGCAHAKRADVVATARADGLYDLRRDAKADSQDRPTASAIRPEALAAETARLFHERPEAARVNP